MYVHPEFIDVVGSLYHNILATAIAEADMDASDFEIALDKPVARGNHCESELASVQNEMRSCRDEKAVLLADTHAWSTAEQQRIHMLPSTPGTRRRLISQHSTLSGSVQFRLFFSESSG